MLHQSRVRTAFTLFEVGICLVLASLSILTLILVLPAGIKVQQNARFRIYAAAKAMDMAEQFLTFANYHALKVSAPGGDKNAITPEAKLPWDTQVAYRAYAPDIEVRLATPRGGILPLPLSIAQRIDSRDDEIKRILDQGGHLYYGNPLPTHGLKAETSFEVKPPSESIRLVFAVVGHAQQNAITRFPWKDWPYYAPYPSPPMTGDVSLSRGPWEALDDPECRYVWDHDFGEWDGKNNYVTESLSRRSGFYAYSGGYKGADFSNAYSGTTSGPFDGPTLPTPSVDDYYVESNNDVWILDFGPNGVKDSPNSVPNIFRIGSGGGISESGGLRTYLDADFNYGENSWLSAKHYFALALWYCYAKNVPVAFIDGTATSADVAAHGDNPDTVRAMRFLAYASICLTRHFALEPMPARPALPENIDPELTDLALYPNVELELPAADSEKLFYEIASFRGSDTKAKLGPGPVAADYPDPEYTSDFRLDMVGLGISLAEWPDEYRFSSPGQRSVRINRPRWPALAGLRSGVMIPGDEKAYQWTQFDDPDPANPAATITRTRWGAIPRPTSLADLFDGDPNGSGSLPAVTITTLGPRASGGHFVVTHDMIVNYHENSLKLIMHWAARHPYNWSLPRPINRAIMMDFPLLQFDCFPSGIYPILSGTITGTTSDARISGGPIAAEMWRPIAAQPIVNLGYSAHRWQVGDYTTSGIASDTPPSTDIWGDPAHFSLTARFDARERCRQLVFWMVDWTGYDDWETATSAPVDASKYPRLAPQLIGEDIANSFTSQYMGRLNTTYGNPTVAFYERFQPLMRNPEKTFLFKRNVSTFETGANIRPWTMGLELHGSGQTDGVTIGETDNDRWDWGAYLHSAHTSRPSDSDPRAIFSGLYGADRNWNQVLDRGPLPRSARIRAVEIARFNIYDPRLELRQR